MTASPRSRQPLYVRTFEPSDFEAWLPLWRAYLAFYGADIDDTVTRVTWERFHRDDEPVYGHGAFIDHDLVGIVHCVRHRATWTQGWYLYLEDLFTRQDLRGQGVARALIQAVYALADDKGASRVYWHTHESNAVARSLYDKVGHNAGFIQYRRPT